MARGFIRKPSFWKIVGAYRSQWKRSIMRFFFPYTYGRKGMGWWHNPKKAAYNWWYQRTSVSAYDLGVFPRRRPSKAFIGLVLGVGFLFSLFTLPVDVAKACNKGHKIKKSRKKRAATKQTKQKQSTKSTPRTEQPKQNTNGASSQTRTAPSSAKQSTGTPKSAATSSRKPTAPTIAKPKSSTSHTNPIQKGDFSKIDSYQPLEPIKVPTPEVPREPDENTPKSKPKHERDQYIRKRMIIAGSSYCEDSAFQGLSIGTYFDLVSDPENPYDKDAIMLTHEGKKIGYMAKEDKPAFVTCLKLNRKIYGVITDIKTDAFPVQYEYETWFDQH